MNILDIILSIVLIFFSFIGFKKGLIKITLFFLACISGWILAGIFEPSLSKFFPEMSLNQNIISGIIYLVLISITIVISNLLANPVKSLLSIFTFGLSSVIDRLGGLAIGCILSFFIISMILLSLSRITYHFEITEQNKITEFASTTPLVKDKIKSVEEQIKNSNISKFSIHTIKSLNLHNLPIVPSDFSNSFETLYDNVID
ncbi:MAG: hypothetical protein CMG57_09865 [Candidatus Marinimicrobia bacterium]|nr:hypothetical protein [Candidatus Neomarinimicrobiota bacterium]|tara:strand:+ start:13297 stop:13902 length:606 start_codon:yes stop_codon:yes gene_type:complete